MNETILDAKALELANAYYTSLPDTVAADARRPVNRLSQVCDVEYWRRQARTAVVAEQTEGAPDAQPSSPGPTHTEQESE